MFFLSDLSEGVLSASRRWLKGVAVRACREMLNVRFNVQINGHKA